MTLVCVFMPDILSLNDEYTGHTRITALSSYRSKKKKMPVTFHGHPLDYIRYLNPALSTLRLNQEIDFKPGLQSTMDS